MLKLFFVGIALALCMVFGGGSRSEAGWRDTGLTRAYDASSLVISVKKHKNDDDDDQGKNKKHNDDDAGLSECTIQQPGGGGGCKGGFKRVCEKMKSGEKCCGCVPDKNQDTSAGQSVPKTGGGNADAAPTNLPYTFYNRYAPSNPAKK